VPDGKGDQVFYPVGGTDRIGKMPRGTIQW